ncbi:MAG: hypothetical protein R3C20_06465 [Planctomycetaceae bacterium]
MKSTVRLFPNWFFDVAWDYTYFAMWLDSRIVWLGCFDDTG